MSPKESEIREEEEPQEEVLDTTETQAEEDIEEVDGVDKNEENGVDGDEVRKDEQEEDIEAPKGHKRKQSPTDQAEPNKAPKTETSDGSKSDPSQVQLLKFLLSDAAVELCRPDDESKDLEKRGKETVTYSSSLRSPFEELLCAVVLSRPISHMLGLRTIRTILNEPYSFTTPEAIKEAGPEKVRQAIWDAHTQHKEKTAEEITHIVDAVYENDWNTSLEAVRKQTGKSVDEEREVLRSNIKGLGKTGLDIFYRRVQWTWEEGYPFIDGRTKKSLSALGLPEDEDELVKLIDDNWNDLDAEESKKYDENEKKRRAFVLILERAVGADLEKKTEQVLQKVPAS